MDNKKSANITRCLKLYKKVTELSEQGKVYPFIQACQEFIDTSYAYFASQEDMASRDLCNGRFFHDICRTLINMKHYSYLYKEEKQQREKDAYADAYWKASDELEKHMETIKEYLEENRR